MKKLLIAALTALLGISVSNASEEVEVKEAQVYELKITIKTTSAKKAKLSASKNPFIDADSDVVVYRAQGSQKWLGLIWGCDCEAIYGKWSKIDDYTKSVSGCIIWNSKSPYTVHFEDDMQWRLLNAIDKTGDKCEAAWTIGESSDSSEAFLAFSGFGTLKNNAKKVDGEFEIADCTSYVKNISGNVAGWMPAPVITTSGRPADCTFCGIVDPGEEDSVDVSIAWNFCECADLESIDFTAISGTWTLKYNASYSKKLSKDISILNVYKKFPASVNKRVESKIKEVVGD